MTLEILLLAALSAPSAAAVVVPTRFEADRIFAVPDTIDGKPLKLYTDTGGGTNLICQSAAQTLGLKIDALKLDDEEAAELGKDAGKTTPVFRGTGVPANADGDASFLVTDCARNPMMSGIGEGLLSSRWFAGRVWTFDYAAHTLTMQGKDWQPARAAAFTPIGLRDASAQGPAFSMPRMTIRIDGHALDMLLDTGATGHPTAEAQSAQGGEAVNGYRATSFITRSTFEALHAAHPQWTVVDKGDDLLAPRLVARVIRVPQVEIGGWLVGPVWFTERPDSAFRQMMSSMTDKPVEGAIGGNALRHFVMTLDYAQRKAYFTCADDCSAARPRPAP